MEIILKEDIIGLGYKNDIVTVKEGYGRNYLIPQGKGVIASVSAKKVLAENLKQQAHKIAAQKAAAEDKAKAFEGIKLEIPAKVSVTGQLYGSVGAAQVVEALEVEVKVPVVVVAENAPAPALVEEVKEEAPVEEIPELEDMELDMEENAEA